MSRISPLPWKMENGCIVTAENDVLPVCGIAQTHGDVPKGDVSRGNAEFIVRAVNCHEELLTALKNLMARELLTIPTPYGHDCAWCGNCYYRAEREALEAIVRAENPDVL